MDIKELYQLYQQHPCITTDSRDCPEGSIFLALKGESFNGNKFAVQALEKGCAYAIVDEELTEGNILPSSSPLLTRIIKVDDCLQTFKDLAREHRRQFNIPVVAITGTNGKTTTKELVAAVLSEQYNVLYTQGNFNNDVGVPKTLFRLNKEHDIAVVEMGASHPGDIKTLVETTEPTCGLITNVGRAHLQGFGSFEGVKRTKGELYDFLASQQKEDFEKGFLFINEDDHDLQQMADERGLIFRSSYGLGDNEDITVKGQVISCAPFLKFSWFVHDEEEGDSEKYVIQTHLIGSYNVYNMLAAISVGLYFDVDEELINQALANYVPSNNRSQLEETAHNHLIVDAYNANPTSMAAALKNFRDMEVAPKMAILGDMRELGEASAEEHQHAVDLMKEYGLEKVWLVGDEFGKTACDYRKFKDVEEVKAAIKEEQPKDYYILIKGSNSMKLFQLPEIL
ncbi:MAG: UDP-N-acetylmuramoyl-tripeptide--D-alanyl-D-alanine ligase [Prevotella sp.]|nr:UDP-N-acetylmuramoyl-tripeptide--D-alanyl-D-alanine ligase [Prevotella sp.]